MRTLTQRLFAACLLLAVVAAPALLSGCGAASGWSRNNVGKRYYRHGNYTAARRSFEQAMIDNPWNPDYAFNVAAAMERQGDHLAAEKMFRHALTLNPSHQPSYRSLAGLLQEQGRHAEAQQLVTAWVETQPYVPEAHVEMAHMQQQMGNLEGAQASMQQALRMDPRHARSAAQMGMVSQRRMRPRTGGMDRRALAGNRYHPQAPAQFGGMANSRPSTALMLAEQMPRRDPLLIPFPSFAGTTPATAVAPGQHMTWMPTAHPAGTPALAGMSSPVMTPQTAPLMAPGASVQAQPMISQPMIGQPIMHQPMTPQPMLATQTGAMLPPAGSHSSYLPAPSASGAYAPVVDPSQLQLQGQPGAAPVPSYAPQPVQLGAPVPISHSPASAVPAVTQALPMVTPF